MQKTGILSKKRLYLQIMKFQNKLQFFFLALALAVFTGQELIHPLFHDHCSHEETIASHFQSQSGNRDEVKETGKSASEIDYEADCPICNSISNKNAETASIQAELDSCGISNYSQSCESFCFLSYHKPVSRGPPCV